MFQIVGAYYERRDNAGDDGEGDSGSYRYPQQGKQRTIAPI